MASDKGPAAGPTRPLQRVKSTLICSGHRALEEHGLYAKYAARLPKKDLELLQTTIVGVWLPISQVLVHYRAAESLGLSAEDAFAIGESSGKRIQDMVIHAISRVAMEAGATPWMGLSLCDRMWTRLFDGGSFQLAQVGPKDAELTMREFPLAEFAYFRHAFRGAIHRGVSLFTTKNVVRETPGRTTPTSFTIRISWV